MHRSHLRLDLAFGTAVLLLGFATVLAFRSIERLRTSQNSLVHTENVLRAIESVASNVREAETSQRGFLLTGQAAFLEPYRTAPAAVIRDLRLLGNLLSADTLQLRRLARLESLAERRLAAMEANIALVRAGDLAGASGMVRTGPGRMLMDSVRYVTEEMADHEFARLQDQRTDEAATAGGTILFVVLGSAGAILIVAASRQGIIRELNLRMRAEGSLETNERYLRELYVIASSPDTTHDDKLQAMLEMGARRFDVALGVIGLPVRGELEVAVVHDPSGSIHAGGHSAVGLLGAVAASGELLQLRGNGSERPTSRLAGVAVETILGTAVMVNGAPRGALVFADPEGRSTPFTASETDFLRIVSQWIGGELERRAGEEAVRQREERYRVLVESAHDLIFTTDRAGRFTYVNPVALSTTGFSREEIYAMHSLDLVRADWRDELQAQIAMQISEKRPSAYYELPIVTATGREIWLGQNLQLLSSDGEISGLQAVARDITGQLEVERMKDEFLSVVSHELRTPLTAIRGSLGLLASGRLDVANGQGRRMLDIAAQNTDRLVRLINDLLDIEKLESGVAPLQWGPVAMAELLQEVTDSLQSLAERQEVNLAVLPTSATLYADHDRLLQVLTNLVSNAIKFCSPGDEVRIWVEARAEDLLVAVADNGRGIPADKLESIFGRFQQVDSSDSRQKGGSGLGLSIARKIVEQHGGRIWVESEWGRGSTFQFILPNDQGSRSRPATPEERESQRSSRHCDVLIVEDDVDLARVIVATLEGRGITTCHAGDGDQAIEMADRIEFALLLLDPGLPSLDGFEVVDRLRSDPRHRHLPVVVYTTRDLTEAERNRLRLGPTEFLTKTRNPLEHLEKRIAAHFPEAAAQVPTEDE